jgi:hypothetical protein
MTTPTGRLAYGQAGIYDAIDDRAVIAAVTGYRTGMVGTVRAAAGAGLNITITGGWLGVADCGDRTSGVVGSVSDLSVQANPGPPTGTREDLIWCEVEPDEGTWHLEVIPASTSAGRAGLPVAAVTVPANATLAAQMTIRPADAMLERRMLYAAGTTDNRTVSSTSWAAVTTPAPMISPELLILPGHWYRVRYWAGSPMKVTGTGTLEGRIGIGQRPGGAPDSASVMVVAATIAFVGLNRPSHAVVDHVFRHPPEAAAVSRQYDGRIYNGIGGTMRINNALAEGPGLLFTVEDLGT